MGLLDLLQLVMEVLAVQEEEEAAVAVYLSDSTSIYHHRLCKLLLGGQSDQYH
jgi:hypothetical protein